jgi:CRP/FNR family transcriptional regulator, cyclic AMP receptor protein
MTDVPAGLPRGSEDPASALYLTETLVDIAERPNFLARPSCDEYRRVRDVGHDIAVSAHQHVFAQGDPHDGIFVIESGSVRTFYHGPSGRELTLAYWTPGHFVGGPEIFGGGYHMWSATAMTDSRLLHLRGASLQRLMAEMPGLAAGLVEGLVFKGKCYSALVQMLGTRSVLQRLAQLLLTLCELEGAPIQEGILIDRTLTHEELANMVGATRQWVTASLDRFQKQSLLEIRERKLVVLDRHRLERIADC